MWKTSKTVALTLLTSEWRFEKRQQTVDSTIQTLFAIIMFFLRFDKVVTYNGMSQVSIVLTRRLGGVPIPNAANSATIF
jgi:hypothetical protein